jgi:hypothetical protein
MPFDLNQKPPVFCLPEAWAEPLIVLTQPQPATARFLEHSRWQVTADGGAELGAYYLDPFRRELEASDLGAYRIGGRVFPVGLGCRYYADWRDGQAPGLGTWRVQMAPRPDSPADFYWIYVDPHGRETPTSISLAAHPEPPVLPRPAPGWKNCPCGSAHICTACGHPYFIEIHGVADGYCTYCYHAG